MVPWYTYGFSDKAILPACSNLWFSLSAEEHSLCMLLRNWNATDNFISFQYLISHTGTGTRRMQTLGMSDSEKKSYSLCGFGFNAFQQLNFQEGGGEGEGASHCSSGDQTASGESMRTQSEQQDEFAVCTPRKLTLFSTRPLLHISSAWDALHIYAESAEGSRTMTTGRWCELVKRMQQQPEKNEKVVHILETKDIMVLQTTSRTLLTSPRNTHKAQLVDCDIQPSTTLCSQSDGSIFARLDNGSVYQCSTATSNGSLSLMLSHQLTAGVPITYISCGTDHTLLLSNTGCVYSLGLGSRGQLGHGDILNRREPAIIEALAGVAMTMVACGSWHSLALSIYGDIYTWGWNEHGQLGHSTGPQAPSTVSLPTLIENPDSGVNFIIVSCGTRHSAAVTEDGQLYTWGWNEYSQLGNGQAGGMSVLPSAVKLSDRVLFVYCEHWNTIIFT